MHSTFKASGSGQAVIQNTTASGIEQLVFKLHPGSDAPVEVEIRDEVPGEGLISSSISIDRDGLRQLVRWLHEQGAAN